MANPVEIDQARRLVLERVEPLAKEIVAVDEALGRVLAEDVTSADPVPGFDSSAMDGYAVRAADTSGAVDQPVELRVVGEARAGHPAPEAVGAGEAIAISTGAMVPDGADAIVRIEHTDRGRERVSIRAEASPGLDLRRAGEDIERGETVLAAGTAIGPAESGVLVSVGRGEVACARRPTVAVFTTGDELQEPGSGLAPGSIRNSNAYSLGALVRQSGAVLAETAIVKDDRDATSEALAAGLNSDVLVISGGVSVGEHDHVRPALAALGVEQVFWRVALRPGGPTYFGTAGNTLVFGLPGNPVSAMVTFLLFARPAIRALQGQDDEHPRTKAKLAVDWDVLPQRTQMVRSRLELRADGWHAHPTKEQGSHVLTSMLGADALAVIPPGDAPLAVGTTVEIMLLS